MASLAVRHSASTRVREDPRYTCLAGILRDIIRGRIFNRFWQICNRILSNLRGLVLVFRCRIAGIAHPYISRVSNATTRRRCNATRFSIQILRSQLRWIGHILRRPETDPLRLVVFEPGTDLCPRLTNTGRKRVVGRPRIDWAQAVIEFFCSFA